MRHSSTRSEKVWRLTRLLLYLYISVSFPRALTALEPQSILQDNVISLQPTGATFVVPKPWMEWHREYHNNIHLTRSQIESVKDADGTWDAFYAQVVNGALPIVNCAVHAGDIGWGHESGALGLQMRAYLGNWSLRQAETLIATKSLPVARKLSTQEPTLSFLPKHVELTEKNVNKWRCTVIRFPVVFEDDVDKVAGIVNIDFYIRPFGPDTIILVFMYPYPAVPSTEEEIRAIVSSFKYPTHDVATNSRRNAN